MPTTRERLRRVRPSAPALGFLGVLFGVIVGCVFLMQRTIVSFDDWNFVLDRRGSSVSFIPNRIDQWINPHNGHPVMVLVAIYRVVGAFAHYSYPLLVAIAAFVHAVFAWTVYVYARRRIGAWLALVPALLIALLGRGAQIILSPIVMAFTLALAAGVASLNLIDGRQEAANPDADQPIENRVPWIRVALLGLFAVGSSGLGVARVITVGIDRIIRTQTNALRARWIVATGGPFVAFAIWYLAKRDGTRNASGLTDTFSFAGRVVANGAAGVVGFGSSYAAYVASVMAALLVFGLVRRRASIDWIRLAALVVGLIVDVGLVSWSRAGNALPASGRYTYVFGAQVCLIAVEVLRGWRVAATRRRVVTLVSVVGVAAAVAAGIGPFRRVADDFRRDNHRTQVALGSFLRAQSAGVAFAPDFQADPELAPQVNTVRLNALVADGQSPIGLRVPRPKTEAERVFVDYFNAVTFVRPIANGTTVEPGAFDFSGEPPVVLDSSNVRLETRGACTEIVATGPGSFVDVQAPNEGITWTVQASQQGTVTIRARNLAEGFAVRPVLESEANGGALATMPSSTKTQNGRPWVVRLQPSSTVRLCKDSGA